MIKTISGIGEVIYTAPKGLTVLRFCFYGKWLVIALSDGTVDCVEA